MPGRGKGELHRNKSAVACQGCYLALLLSVGFVYIFVFALHVGLMLGSRLTRRLYS